MPKKYVVALTADERKDLTQLLRKGKAATQTFTHARILLKADCSAGRHGWTDEAIQEACDASLATIERVRRRYALQGFEAALKHKKLSRHRSRRLDGTQEAHLVALVCSEPPPGHAHWTMRLLAEKMVALTYVEELSHETVRRTLKKNELKPWLKKEWCIPPKAKAAFVAQMEEVLDFYQRPYDPRFPLVCMDEKSKQVLADTRPSLHVQAGQVLRQDFEYERKSTCNLFIAFEPSRSWRQVTVTAQRTAVDWARFMQQLADIHYPAAERILVVLDNLNTHHVGSFYEVFALAEARRVAQRFEFHYTPKHGSWLNMAEIELSVLDHMCLAQRFANGEQMTYEVAIWQKERNAKNATVDWRFTTEDARIKLKKLYPSILM